MRLELTRRADYGIRALIAIARAAPDRPMSAPRIAEAMAIPARFLPQVMADLVRADLVASTGGRRGGYHLSRPASDINLLEIIEALEGDARRRQCVLRAAPCGKDGTCDVHDVIAAAQDALLARFEAARLSDLVGRLGTATPDADADLRADADGPRAPGTASRTRARARRGRSAALTR